MLNLLTDAVKVLLGGLVAGGVVSFLTQRWIAQREFRDRRDRLRLELYVDVLELLSVAQRSSARLHRLYL
jgi:hypothetical protein